MRLTSELLAQPEPPTALFAASDTQAFGVLEAAVRAGVEVPRHLGLDERLLDQVVGSTGEAGDSAAALLRALTWWQPLRCRSSRRLLAGDRFHRSRRPALLPGGDHGPAGLLCRRTQAGAAARTPGSQNTLQIILVAGVALVVVGAVPLLLLRRRAPDL